MHLHGICRERLGLTQYLGVHMLYNMPVTWNLRQKCIDTWPLWLKRVSQLSASFLFSALILNPSFRKRKTKIGAETWRGEKRRNRQILISKTRLIQLLPLRVARKGKIDRKKKNMDVIRPITKHIYSYTISVTTDWKPTHRVFFVFLETFQSSWSQIWLPFYFVF